MNDVNVEKTNFSCPSCKLGHLKVFVRGGNPIAYRCRECSAKFEATWTLDDDDESTKVLEQAIDNNKEVHDLGIVDVKE